MEALSYLYTYAKSLRYKESFLVFGGKQNFRYLLWILIVIIIRNTIVWTYWLWELLCSWYLTHRHLIIDQDQNIYFFKQTIWSIQLTFGDKNQNPPISISQRLESTYYV